MRTMNTYKHTYIINTHTNTHTHTHTHQRTNVYIHIACMHICIHTNTMNTYRRTDKQKIYHYYSSPPLVIVHSYNRVIQSCTC